MSYAILGYDRARAVEYAKRWAFGRNPLYIDYAGVGGDCTSFVSQCVLAGSCEMNYTPVYGWYYLSPNERTASWTGVEFFYDFITTNADVGPFGREVVTFGQTENQNKGQPGGLLEGDIIQLGRSDGDFYHTLIVTGFDGGGYLVSAHTDDSLDRPLSTYSYAYARFLHIEGVRIRVSDAYSCFDDLINGRALPGRASVAE